MKIFIIGSVSHMETILKTKEFYQKSMGRICTVESVYPQPDKSLDDLISECFRKIDEADLVVAVPKPDGTFGTGTTYEIQFAKYMNKTVVLNNDFDCVIYSRSDAKRTYKPMSDILNVAQDPRVKALSEKANKEVGYAITWLSAVDWVERTFSEMTKDFPAPVDVEVIPVCTPVCENVPIWPISSVMKQYIPRLKIVFTLRDYPIHAGSINFVCKYLVDKYDFIDRYYSEP